MRLLKTWLPLALVWAILIHASRPLLVDTVHDLTRDVHTYQVRAWGGITLMFVAALILSLALCGWMMGRARRAIVGRQRGNKT
jgi:hypothetical protein